MLAVTRVTAVADGDMEGSAVDDKTLGVLVVCR